MLSWLRNTFGACKDRWFHDWVEFEQGGEHGIGGKRRCRACELEQVCVGAYQPDMDLALARQWESVEVKR